MRAAEQPEFSAVLADEDLTNLSQRGIVKALPRNVMVVTEGDRTDSLYIILSGKVKVFVSDANGREAVLGLQGAGEYFGEMVLDEGPRSASVMTVEPSRFVIVPKPQLKQFLSDNPGFALHLIQKLTRRIRTLTENVRSLALMDVYGRVARLLLELASDQDGKLVVTERLTHQDFASRVGASREMIGRILKDLVAGGYISITRKRITIHRNLPQRW